MKKSFFLFVALLLCIFLIGCSPLDLFLGPSGSIGITTYPTDAKIFLNNNDTGYFTPHTFTNLIKGSYKVTVTLDDISYTEIVKVYSNCPTDIYKDLLPRLEKIIIDPDFLYTEIGETRDFSKITAYYFDIDHWPTEIKLSNCSYIKDNDHAIINSEKGTFTGISKGQTKVTISYTEREFTKIDLADIYIGTFPTPSPSPEPEPEPTPELEPTGKVIITLDNLHQEYYEFLGKWSMIYVYYTITNNSNKTINDYEIYFKVICIDDSIYYDSCYKDYALSSSQSHSDYCLIDTFGKQANSVQITDFETNVYY